MRRTLGSVLLLAVCSLTALADDLACVYVRPDPSTDLISAVCRLAKGEEEDPTKPINDVTSEAHTLATNHDLQAVMKLFKPKSKGGSGIGNLVKGGHKDGIELLIRDYAIEPPKKKEVTGNAEEMIRIGRIAFLIAEMNQQYAEAKAIPRNIAPARWKALAKDMQDSSADLIAAARAKDEKAVAVAANKLNQSYVTCHKEAR